MTIYVTYQCSVCRRIKDSLKDKTRATPNQCNITKGCSGRLFKIGESNESSTVDPRSDLVDWYPRGQQQNIIPESAQAEPISLITSNSGVLTIAVYQTAAEATARPNLKVKLIQRKTAEISYQQFLFKFPTTVLVVAGKDTTGKNLRFDQQSIDEGRVFVRVNGVARFSGNSANEVVLTPNKVTFNSEISADATIDISIYNEVDTVEKMLDFTANRAFIVNANSGAWGNIRYVNEYDINGQLKPDRWWIYSCTNHGILAPASRIKFDEVYLDNADTVVVSKTELHKVRFLLASPPRANADRYLNFFVDCGELYKSFSLLTGNGTSVDISADANTLREIYPPLQLTQNPPYRVGSFVTPDVFTYDNSIISDTSQVRLTGKKILGPI